VRALLIANAIDADPGFVGERFRDRGYAFEECLREQPGEWPVLEGHDLVLLLGSEWSVYWPEVAHSVAAEAALVRTAHAGGIPVFGVCFGNQVMAHALGGSVQRSPVPEIGWYAVQSDQPQVIAEGPWLQWHYDVVTVPPGAVEMARSEVGPQAWRMGRSFCTQFHPEATETMLDRWSRSAGADELKRFGSSREQLMERTRECVVQSRVNADRLVDWFCDTVIDATHPAMVEQGSTNGPSR
jgi:GMP synthase-like glutamine amidotransferase